MIVTTVFRAVVPWRGTLGGVVLGLVPAMSPLSVFHVGVFVDHRHHVGNSLGVGLEHLLQFNTMEALNEVVDDVPVINLHNGITVSEVRFDVVTEGLIGLLDDTAQIPSGFGTRAGCLEILDEGIAQILPAVDGAARKSLEPVEGLAAKHHREVGCHDVVVTVSSSDGDGVNAQPRLC